MYLLDTNHCSRLIFGDVNIRQKVEEIGEELIATNLIVAGELIFMAQKSEYKGENLAKVQAFLADINIYGFDEQTTNIYGELKAKIINIFGPKEKARKRKFTIQKLGISDNDLWIASTVIQEDLILVSRDEDFLRIKQAHNFLLESWIL
jgi:tRNA(fMet)-specific endonuclease VapC